MRGFGGIRRAAGTTAAGTALAAALLTVPTATAATAATAASAVAPTGPATAIAVAPDGTSYVGFGSGGAVARLAADGRSLAPMPVDVDGPVDGVAVDPTGQVWVDDGDSVAAHRPDGTVLVRFAHVPATPCVDDDAHDPASYGGIAVTASAVYVAGRCSGDLEVYDRTGGLRARVDLPGPALPRGVAWGRAQAELPARLYVAQPDAARVLVYDADTLTSASTPVRTLAITRVSSAHATPVPSGVVVDRYGQLGVADRANHALYLYDANNDLVRYRVLGHPPAPSSEPGALDAPTALAQHDQDGGSMAGELWVADAGNGRVQRWTTGGWTIWTAAVADPRAAAVPVNTAVPVVTGTPVPGSTLTCDPGTWRPEPTGLRFRWTRDGLLVPGAEAATLLLTSADLDTEVACTVVAVGAGGSSAPAASAAVAVPGPRSIPISLTRPALTGTARPGQALDCGSGTWTGTPTSYTRAWRWSGVARPDTDVERYVVTDADVGSTLSCQVRARNGVGTSAWAVSEAVTVSDSGGLTPDPPESLLPPAVVGTPRPGRVLACRPGTWTGTPTLSVTWRAGALRLGVGSTYAVTVADVGRQVTCTVRAVTTGGTASATAAPVTVLPAPDPPAPSTACTGAASVLLGGGADWTRRRQVDLRVRTPAGTTRIEIADNPDFVGAQRRTLHPRCAYRWRLTGDSDGAPKRVWVRFPGAPGSGPVSDTIRLDDTAPVILRAHARWRNRRDGWVLSTRAADRGAGVMWFQVAKADGSGRRTYRPRQRVVTSDRSYLQRVRFADRLGNLSGWVRVRFLA